MIPRALTLINGSYKLATNPALHFLFFLKVSLLTFYKKNVLTSLFITPNCLTSLFIRLDNFFKKIGNVLRKPCSVDFEDASRGAFFIVVKKTVLID